MHDVEVGRSLQRKPEQVLLVTSSSPVNERALVAGITVRLLPARHPKQRPNDGVVLYQWNDTSEIGQDILARSTPVALTYVPSDDNGGTSGGGTIYLEPATSVGVIAQIVDCATEPAP